MQKDELVELAKAKIKELTEEFDSACDEVSQAEHRKSVAEDSLQAWKTILNGLEATSLPSKKLWLAEDRQATNLEMYGADGVYGTKTEAIRRGLQYAGAEGATPKALTEFVQNQGITLTSSFASNALFRMKERREVFQEGGRYYLSKYDLRKREPFLSTDLTELKEPKKGSFS